MLTHAQIAGVANEVLQATLGPHGFERAEVADDVDPEGVAAVRVLAHFRPGSQPADGRAVVAALSGLHAQLRALGEERFPFLRYAYPDDEIPGADPEDFDP